MARLTEIGWEDFHALPLEAKRAYLERTEGDGMPYHTLFAQQFDRERMAEYFGVTRPALSRAIGQLRDRGLLSWRKNVFTIRF